MTLIFILFYIHLLTAYAVGIQRIINILMQEKIGNSREIPEHVRFCVCLSTLASHANIIVFVSMLNVEFNAWHLVLFDI